MALLEADFKLLHDAPLFSGLSRPQMSLITNAVSVRSYTKGETVFHAGDHAERFYLIASGWVRLIRTTRDGEDAVIGLFTKGETFAEAAMFLSRGYPATAVTGSPARLLCIDARYMLDALRREPDLALGMLASMSVKLKSFIEQFAINRVKSTHHRLAEFLLSLTSVEAGSETIELPFEKRMIANRLGMTPESLSRALAKLREINVRIDGGRTFIPDIDRLRAFVDQEN